MTWGLLELIQNRPVRENTVRRGGVGLRLLRSLSREYNVKFMASQCLQKSLAEENSFYGEMPEGYEDHLFILTL